MDYIKKMFKKIFYVTVGIFTTCLIMALFLNHFYEKPTGEGNKQMVLEIKKGDTADKISSLLQKEGFISSNHYLSFLFRITQKSHLIKQGHYEIHDGMRIREIYSVLLKGKVRLIKITIPEGFHNRQIASLFVKKKIIKHENEFFAAAKDPVLLKKYQIPAQTVEGYLLPETYSVPQNYPVKKLVDLMMQNFFKKLKNIPEVNQKSPKELHEKIILASIIERETKKEFERPLMASVFMNRIEKNIKLESCATIQYAFDEPKKRLLYKDLKIQSPYNTYIHGGYPPTPISNPGVLSLQAAFSPAKTDYLYFLVKPDDSHYFSKSFGEHLLAKKKFIDPLYQ